MRRYKKNQFLNKFLATIIFSVLFFPLSPFLSQAQYQEQSSQSMLDNSPYAPGEVIVKFKDSSLGLGKIKNFSKMSEPAMAVREQAMENAAFSLAEDENIEIKDTLATYNLVLYKTQNGESVEDLIVRLKQNPNVEFAELNYQHIPAVIDTNDTHRDLLWGLDNTGQLIGSTSGLPDADVDAPEAWTINEGTNATIIAADVDNGIGYGHLDLVNNMWNGANCVDHNGDFLGGCMHGYNYALNDKFPFPSGYGYNGNAHGTHIAGTIGAIKNNERGIIGLAPNVKLMALKSDYYSYNNILSYDFATQNGAKIINASYVSGGGTLEKEAIKRFEDSGGLFIAAAANYSVNNDTNPYMPASFNLDGIISVAATGQSDTMAGFSNWGPKSVDVAAPGVSIYSTVCSNSYCPNGNSYGYMSGTSMATPHVVGLAALIWGTNPNLTNIGVKNIIMSTGDSLPSLAGKILSGKRINAQNALAALSLLDSYIPNGGYDVDGIIPVTQINYSESTGDITVNFKVKDNYPNLTEQLSDFSYSIDGGTTWEIPVGGDESEIFSGSWNKNSYVSSLDYSGSAFNFKFNSRNPEATGLNNIESNNVRIRFKVNNGINTSDYVVSEIFSINNDNSSPNQFTFIDQTDVPTSTTVESNQITVSGIDTPVIIAISGCSGGHSCQYSVNGGAYTSTAGTVVNGDTVKVKMTTAYNGGVSCDLTLNIGWVTDTFSLTTIVDDILDSPFSFTDKTGVPLNTPIESNTISISGINSPITINMTNCSSALCEYSINGGIYTSNPGIVNNNDSVKIRQTSSPTLDVTTDLTLNIGGLTDTFSVSTNPNTIPITFDFTNKNSVALNTSTESNTITVSGINMPSPISITSCTSTICEYSINGGAYTTVEGIVLNGDTVSVRQTSSGSNYVTSSLTLSIGGVTDIYNITTIALPVTNYNFSQSIGSYNEITGGTLWQSGSWDDPRGTISIGFSFSANGIPVTSIFANANGYLNTGTSSLGYQAISSTEIASLVISALSHDLQGKANSEIRYQTSGTAPNRVFTIQWKNAQRYGSNYNDETLNFQIKLYETSNKIEFIYGTFIGTAYSSPTHPQVGLRSDVNTNFLNRTTTNNWSLSTSGATNTATMTLNSTVVPVSGLTYRYAESPMESIFVDQNEVALNTTIESNIATISWINTPASISITSCTSTICEYSINGGAYTSIAGTVSAGDTVRVRQTSSTSGGITTNLILDIGGLTDTFSITTIEILPTVVSLPATTLALTSVLLNGEITNSGGVLTSRGFEYGLTTSYGTTITENGPLEVGTFSSNLTSLTSNTTYHYRAYATNSAGTNYGADQTFTTLSILIPEVETSEASSITTTTAILNGTIVNTGGQTTARGFHYGLNTNYGQILSNNGSFSTGNYSLNLTSLICGTTYHFRSYATNSAGTGYGSDQTFTTTTCNLKPVAISVLITGSAYSGNTLTGSYVYFDQESNPEGNSIYRWYRDNVAILNSNSISYTSTTDDIDKIIKFQVTPIAQSGTTTGVAVQSEGLLIKKKSSGGGGGGGGGNTVTPPVVEPIVTTTITEVIPIVENKNNCKIGDIFDSTTGLKCPTSNEIPQGCTPYTLFSPLTGIKCPIITTTTTPITTNTIFTRTLKLGMQGNDVKELQIYLNTHGYPIALYNLGSLGKETTSFGSLTKKAVIKFQIANGLVGDGVVGKMTREKMK